MWKVLSFQPRQKDELPCVYSKPVSSAIRRLCSSCAYLNCFFSNFFWIENVIPYSPFYNPPFQAPVSCISEKLTKPHLPRSAQATNVPHNHWRYRTAPMGSPTMAHWSLVSKLPNSKLKYCCCNKTGKAKRTSKTFSCSKKINKKTALNQRLLYLLGIKHFWFLTPSKKWEKPGILWVHSPSQRLARLLWSVDFPLVDYFPPGHRQFSRNKPSTVLSKNTKTQSLQNSMFLHVSPNKILPIYSTKMYKRSLFLIKNPQFRDSLPASWDSSVPPEHPNASQSDTAAHPPPAIQKRRHFFPQQIFHTKSNTSKSNWHQSQILQLGPIGIPHAWTPLSKASNSRIKLS